MRDWWDIGMILLRVLSEGDECRWESDVLFGRCLVGQ